MLNVNVVFFDAVGTLFRVKDGVGHIYSRIAADYGVSADPLQVDRCFYRAFKSAPPAAFPDAGDRLQQLERDWWRDLVMRTFGEVGVLDRFNDFSSYFRDVFDIFATADAWELYDETLTVLDALRDRGIPVSVISNFDSRLYAVLQAMGLDGLFNSVTVSTAVGSAKPDAGVFRVALAQEGIAAATALHVGDSQRQDYRGAKQVGMQALWLDRVIPQIAPDLTHQPADATLAAETIADLSGVLECLGVVTPSRRQLLQLN